MLVRGSLRVPINIELHTCMHESMKIYNHRNLEKQRKWREGEKRERERETERKRKIARKRSDFGQWRSKGGRWGWSATGGGKVEVTFKN